MRALLPFALVVSGLFAACSGDTAPAAPTNPPVSGGSAGAGGESSEGGAGGDDGEGAGSGGAAGSSTCASGKKTQTTKGADMNGGRACLACHQNKVGLLVAGTVFGVPNQENRCAGAEPDGSPIEGAVITLTDDEGTVVDVDVRPGGNFLVKRADHPLVPPFRVKLSWDGREIEKQVPVESGDCNLCHSQKGDNGASGRIVLP